MSASLKTGVRGRADAQKDTKTDQELGFCHGPALPKEWGPRNTRKDAKEDEMCGLGGPYHIARPDIGRGRDALLRDPAWHVQKNVQRQYLTCPSELVPLRAGPVTTPALPKNGARETREKTRKRMRGVGWEAHITSRPDIERDRGRDDDSGRPSLRTGQANFWHPALQLVVTSKKIGKPQHAPVLRRTSQP